MSDTIIIRFDFVGCEPIRTRYTSEVFDANVDVLTMLHRAGVVTVEVDTGQDALDWNTREFGIAGEKGDVSDGVGILTRIERGKAAHTPSDPRAGIRAYCRGNKWLTENAKAVGNW